MSSFKSYLFLFTTKWLNKSLYKLFRSANLTVLLILLGTVRSVSSVSGLNCDSKKLQIEDSWCFRNQGKEEGYLHYLLTKLPNESKGGRRGGRYSPQTVVIATDTVKYNGFKI